MKMRNQLEISDIHLAFGGVKALSGVSLQAEEQKITALIGPNGSGKTSLFNVISGFYPAQKGSVLFEGIELLQRPAHHRANLRIARTFQNIALFSGMTVLENIKLGAHAQIRTGLCGAAVYFGKTRREEAKITETIDRTVIAFLDLQEFRDRSVAGLPYGVQKRIELARAMVTRPKLLMLDEPFAGMNSTEKIKMGQYIRGIVEDIGCTTLLIDHDMESIMTMSDHIVVLNFGKVIAAGEPKSVQCSPEVIEAYLGEE